MKNYAYYQTGFSMRNVRSFFNALSEDSFFTLQIYEDAPNGVPMIEVFGLKEDSADVIRKKFNCISSDVIYESMSIQCNSGFGNSVTVTLYHRKG